MKRLLLIALGCLLILAGFYGCREQKLNRDERLVTAMLRQRPEFSQVEIRRTKGGYNVLGGRVRTEQDMKGLREQLQQLGVTRCIMGVRMGD